MIRNGKRRKGKGFREDLFFDEAMAFIDESGDNLTAHLDVLPTLCELAGAEVPASLRPKLEGFGLKPLLEAGAAVRWHDDRMLFQHVARWPGGLAASHKYAMCGVRRGHHLLLRSTPCDDPACEHFQSQCTTLRLVGQGMTKTTYTDGNAQHHWGVSPADRWVLFDVKNDPACEKDLGAKNPELVSTMGAAYDAWWEGVFPQMIQAGGDQGAGVPRRRPGTSRNRKPPTR